MTQPKRERATQISAKLKDALQSAIASYSEIIFVTVAGNSSQSAETLQSLPAAIDLPIVPVVGATGQSGDSGKESGRRRRTDAGINTINQNWLRRPWAFGGQQYFASCGLSKLNRRLNLWKVTRQQRGRVVKPCLPSSHNYRMIRASFSACW